MIRGGSLPIAQAVGLGKLYREGETPLYALRNIDLEIERGEYLGIRGPSGSGKSTLLHILGCLDSPTAGEYLFDGRRVTALDDRGRSRLRATVFGFVFQSFNLVPRLTVLENTMLPSLYRDEGRSDARAKAREAIGQVGLGERSGHYPSQLSGGEMQRAAIARALASRPLMILADEPTGNLDSENAAAVLGLFRDLNVDGITVVVASHEQEVLGKCGRVITLRDGRLQS